MTEEQLLNISGFLIVTLLGVIAYFLKEFNIQVKHLKQAVIELQIAIRSDKAAYDGWRENEREKHDVINKRLDDHGRRLDLHEIEITAIKTKHSSKHENY
jgi:hypothetical protein